jgi:AcrR family transcriptional regulator
MPRNHRERVLEAALKLYGRYGFHATGIDRIVAESGVAKMTLYKHFKSKEDLTVAALRLCDERLRRDLEAGVEGRKPTSPAERLLAVFDVLHTWLSSPEYQGCPFIKASSEYASARDPIHAAAQSHKEFLNAYLLEQARALGEDEPERLSTRLLLLIEGAIVVRQVLGRRDAAVEAREAARALLGTRRTT